MFYFSLIFYLYHPRAIEKANAFSSALAIAVYIAVLAVPTNETTLAVLKVEFPVTDNVFAKVPEPETIRSSKPIASSVILPDTTKLPETNTSPEIVVFDEEIFNVVPYAVIVLLYNTLIEALF
jgi:hypothetical protein